MARRAATLPPVTLVRQFDTHRLIPSRHRMGDAGILAGIAGDTADVQALVDLDAATDDRRLAEHERLPGIGLAELVFAVPHAEVINAPFCYAQPLGSRFNGPDRGAWYAAFALATAQAEVGFHKAVQLAEIGRFDDTVTYDDFCADFSASFHDLRRLRGFRACLDPASYVASQTLAERLLAAGALGVVYPSVRHASGTCLACFRPAPVTNVRRTQTYRFTWEGQPKPTITVEWDGG